MTNAIYNDVTKRHDFVLLFDVTDGNPNGDPDAGNLPRVDPETMQGLVTDVCIKRKVRNFIDVTNGNKANMKIYVQNKGILANEQKRAYEAIKAEPGDSPNEEARKWMCQNYYDVRMFGVVMTTGKTKDSNKKWNCGQVRGPLQLTFARSIDPVIPLDLSITRVALTNAGDTGIGQEDDEIASSSQMGRKALLPYGLYLGYGFFTPTFAKDTGVSNEDLKLFWSALQNIWDIDHSASRGLMACRGLYIFSHNSELGNASAHTLFDRIKVKRNDNAESTRCFSDYKVSINETNFPEGVTLTKLVG
ncbi:MAG: type I-C CRISPR-associated protein Cas7/Csd2 [Candidatus Brocadia sp.]|nr:type I-C CRISPR-associated protein Cas7/Csd2 [Candidatus Brocadia sp.]